MEIPKHLVSEVEEEIKLKLKPLLDQAQVSKISRYPAIIISRMMLRSTLILQLVLTYP